MESSWNYSLARKPDVWSFEEKKKSISSLALTTCLITIFLLDECFKLSEILQSVLRWPTARARRYTNVSTISEGFGSSTAHSLGTVWTGAPHVAL